MTAITQWHILLKKYQDRTLHKDDLVEMLRAGVSPPDEALAMIADVLSSDKRTWLKTSRRPKTVLVEDGFVAAEHYLPQHVDYLEAVYGMPRQQAKLAVLRWYNEQPGKSLSMRQLEEWRKKWKPDDDRGQAEYEKRVTNAWRDAQ